MLFGERSNALLPEKRCSAEMLTKSGALRKVFKKSDFAKNAAENFFLKKMPGNCGSSKKTINFVAHNLSVGNKTQTQYALLCTS